LHNGLASGNDGPRQQVLIRPEHVQVTDNGLAATVESCIFQGERYLLALRLQDGQTSAPSTTCALREQQHTGVRLLQGWRLEAA
jgi:iron(III) transport system ATP-binding protein